MAGSLRGYVSDFPAVLVCEMSDGTKRLVVTSRGVPVGGYDDVDSVEMPIDPAPAPKGTTAEQPPSVPFDFYNYSGEASDYPFEPILAELLFTSYVYDEGTGFAIWTASLFVDDVCLSEDQLWISANSYLGLVPAIFG